MIYFHRVNDSNAGESGVSVFFSHVHVTSATTCKP